MDFDEFSDDGLDDLPDNALQELENQAISFTQAQQVARQRVLEPTTQNVRQQHVVYTVDDDDDLDTSEVINNAGPSVVRPSVASGLPHHHRQPPIRPKPPLSNPQWNPMINPSNPLNASQSSKQMPQRFSHANISSQNGSSQRFQPHQPQNHYRPLPQSQFTKSPLPANAVHLSQNPSSQNQPRDVLSALQQRVRALEAELNATRGEVSIIRANSTKESQRHSEEIARLKKLNAEQLQKQERIIDAAVAKEKTASTELQFLQQDLKNVASSRSRQAPQTGRQVTGATTPKKAKKSWGIVDGFDDMEMLSPNKKGKNGGAVAANVGERTPTKGKRKRPTADSPIMALETHVDETAAVPVENTRMLPPEHHPVVLVAQAPPFEFLQLVLDHAAFHQQPPTFETLSRFAFPSDPTTSLSSLIFHKLPMMGSPNRPMQLLVDFCEQIISLWKRCVEEAFWEPIKYLVSLIAFTFQLHTTSVAALVIPTLTCVAQDTILKLAEYVHRLSDGDLSQNDNYTFLKKHIDISRILGLLHTSALASITWEQDSGSGNMIAEFWRLMTLCSVTLLLTPKQEPEHTINMLNLLATSSLPDTIGPRSQPEGLETTTEAVIERVSAKLVETPCISTTDDVKRRIRITTLRTMISFARYPFGAQQLAIHKSVIPRLVVCLSTTIDSLYDQSIPPGIFHDHSYSATQNHATTQLYRIISQCVILIHALVTGPVTGNLVDMGTKLSGSHGGSQRYLIALGRLTFAEEDLVIEAGIESEIVEMAHELLEMAVTPEEGEILSEVFGA